MPELFVRFHVSKEKEKAIKTEEINTALTAIDDLTPEIIDNEIAELNERLVKLKAIRKAVGGKVKATRKPRAKKQPEAQTAEA